MTHSFIIRREGLISTMSILPYPQGSISWSSPCRKIVDYRLSVFHQNLWEIHHLCPRDFPGPSRIPLGFSLGKSLGSQDISWASGKVFLIPSSFCKNEKKRQNCHLYFVPLKSLDNMQRGQEKQIQTFLFFENIIEMYMADSKIIFKK